MNLDMLESGAMDRNVLDLSDKMKKMHSGFESAVKPESGTFSGITNHIDKNISNWLGVKINENTDLSAVRGSFMDTAKVMYYGEDLGNGHRTLGLNEINARKRNPDYYYQNLKQQSGFSAEIIGTAKENMQAKIDGTGITTYRADDLAKKHPDLFSVNDQYVDKVRIDSNGYIVDTIQVKFVGNNAESCLSKLMSKSYDKYYENNNLTKM